MSDTSFENNNLDIEHLPTTIDLDLQDISKKYAPTNLIIGIVFYVLLLVIMAITYYQPFITVNEKLTAALPLFGVATLIFALFQVTIGYYSDLKKRYALRQLDLHYGSGLFFRKLVSQPITRIQHIELKRGPIDRKIGLAKLQVFSAGGATHTFEIPGLALNRAQQIRQFIIQHKHVSNHDW